MDDVGFVEIAPRGSASFDCEGGRRRGGTFLEPLRTPRLERATARERGKIRNRAFNACKRPAWCAAWNRGQKAAGVRMLRRLKDSPYGAFFYNASRIHHRH